MKHSKFFFFTGIALMIVGLMLTSPAQIVFAGITPTPTYTPTNTPSPTNTPAPTDTPPAAVNTPIPATNTPRPNTGTPATATPISTPESIPELGSGPSTTFIRFGVLGILLGGLFIFGGWFQLLRTE